MAWGVEASAGYNITLIKPKSNFKFSDLEGLGTCFSLNYGIFSFAILGNSKVGYPENSVFETYYGIRIGVGVGFGGSYSPATNTKFYDWIPNITQSNIFYRH